MKSTTQGYKDILASGNARKYLCKIDLTLANNTVLHLTEEDLWEDSFKIDTATSGTSSFDIGSAIIGKCSFTINDIEGTYSNYDFFNADAVVWVGLDGDKVSNVQQYYRMGFFTVDEPKKAQGLISLELLDNMWKFDVPFSGVNITYPATARSIILTICTYCGVFLSGSTQYFHGYNFSVAEAPKDDMNCREMLQYLAMIGCNFCVINASGELEIKWYNTSQDVFNRNFSTNFSTDDIEITGVKFVIDKTEHTIGTTGYVLELSNPLVNEDNVNTVLNLIWDVLHANNTNFTFRTFNITTLTDLAAEPGDKIKFKDYKGNDVYSYITLNSFAFANHLIQCNAISPNRTLVKRYSKTVQAAVEEARHQTNQIISNYDLDVQELNKLVVQSMGAFTEYEEAPTGGRIFYSSNMPITKSASGQCSFESGSIVFRMAGDVLSVSTDGGTTWVNGYDPTTGKLIVNVLSAIGIQFDWARGGTLTLGGYGNGNGELSIQNASNVEKVHGDNTGIKVGGSTGSKIFETVNGQLQYYYDNSYCGQVVMNAVNHGTEQDPDIRDEFTIEDFDYINIETDNSNADIYMRSNLGGQGEIYLTADSSQDANGLIKLEAKSIYLGDSILSTPVDLITLNGDALTLGCNTLTINGNNGVSNNMWVIGPDNVIYLVGTTKGIVTNFEATNNVIGHWHTWESGGTTYEAIVLGAGVTYAEFPSIDSNGAYEPYIQAASGQPVPKINNITITGTTFRVDFTAVTSAQAAGNACVIKLWRVA